MGEKPGGGETDDLDRVLHFGQRTRAPVEDVEHGRSDEAHHQRRDHREQAGKL